MTTLPPPLRFADLEVKVGRFMLHWSTFEGQLSQSIVKARKLLGMPDGPVRGTLSEQLDEWHALAPKLPHNFGHAETADQVKAQVHALRPIRNTIVHGLRGGNSQPDEGPPHIVCVVGGTNNPSGEVVRYSLDDLEHFLQAADACRRAFIQLRNFNYQLHQPPPPP